MNENDLSIDAKRQLQLMPMVGLVHKYPHHSPFSTTAPSTYRSTPLSDRCYNSYWLVIYVMLMSTVFLN